PASSDTFQLCPVLRRYLHYTLPVTGKVLQVGIEVKMFCPDSHVLPWQWLP
uniref:Uncharacterized protein n=1 Tax=Amphimedon queenslandica TaxID=400682 RepID=A0A1X7ULE7_AMPQE